MKFVETQVELLDITKTYAVILWKLEQAGRTCYQSKCSNDTEKQEAFLRNIMKAGHESVIEHECLTFKIITDRAIANQIVRHRIASYSQLSTRYVDHSNLEVILPKGMTETEAFQFKYALAVIEDNYKNLINAGVHKDIARGLLPQCTATELVMTMNLRELRHFLKLRLDKHAHEGIREVAKGIYDIMKERFPVFVFDIEVE